MIRIFAIFFLIFLTTATPGLGEPNRREPLSIVDCEYMPFYFKGGNGEVRGIFVDLWKLWSEKTGIPVEFRLYPWEEAVRQVKDGKVDIIGAIFYTSERDTYLDFSIPFFNETAYLFHHVSVPPPEHPNRLTGYRVGAVTGDFSADFLKKTQHSALTEYSSHERLVTEAIDGNVDAFIMEGPVASTYLAKHDGLNRIQRVEQPAYTPHFRAAVREDNKALLRIIDRGMTAITPKEIDTIVRSWTGEPYSNPADQFPKKVVIAASIDQMPFHFVDENGRAVGMFIDLWRLWGRVTGTEITFKTGTWSESLGMVRNGTADIHAGCFYSKERDRYLDYVTPLKDCDTHFFFHQSIFGLKNLEDLVGFKIGALENDYAADFVRQKLPGAYIAEYPTNEKLFDAVEKGEVRVFVGDTPTALFFLSKKGLLHEYHHHPASPLYRNTYFATVKKGDAALVSAVSQGFDAITAEERAAIERRWMGTSDYKTKDVLVFSYDKAYPPFSMLDSEGRPSGMLIDIWRFWAKKTGEKIEFRGFSGPDAANAVAVGGADVHVGMPSGHGRENSLAFSHPIYQLASHLFYRSDQKIDRIDNLGGRRIGAVRNSGTESWLLERLPAKQIQRFETEEALVIAALERKIDVFAGPLPVILSFFSRNGRMSEFIYHSTPLFTQPICAAVVGNNPALLTALDAGLNAIDHDELIEIESSWISDSALRYYKPRSHQITLSEGEKKWIQRRGKIRLGVPPDLPPFDFIDTNGNYTGISSDYVRILNERLGIHIDVVPDLGWSDVISKARADRREIDMISSVAGNEGLKGYRLLTTPYASFPWVIITRREAPLIGKLRDLYGKPTVVVRDFAVHERLVREHPDIPLQTADSVISGLNAVSMGKAEAFVGNLAAASYQIQKHNLADLKIAASTEYDSEGISFAIRSDWPELVSILNKGMATISSEEQERIRQRWFSVRFEHGIDPTFIRKIILKVSAVGSLLFILFFLWHRQMRKARYAAEAANRSKSEFLASLSHEIRTPMNVIMGMTDITLRTRLDSEQKMNLTAVRKAAGHLLELIEDILDLSKIEAGKVNVLHTVFDLDGLLNGIIDTYTLQARQKWLPLELKKSDDVPRWIKGDPTRLRQILVNLIGNAIKFTDEGFIRMDVVVKETEVEDPVQKKIYLDFLIQDTGIGIPTDKQNIIFDSFTSGDSASTRRYGGAGLGLAICRKFAELMGGIIDVTSRVGEGSTFSFSVPFEPVEAPAPGTEETRIPGALNEKTLTVLVAEDSGPNAAVTCAFLKEMGHRAVVVDNGNQVIRQLREQRFDIVLMDVEMPETDGPEATRAIRNGVAGPENIDIPIIAMTAHVLEDCRQRCQDAGMNGFLGKPVDFHELKNVLLSSGHWLPGHDHDGKNAEIKDDIAEKTLLDRQNALLRLGNDENLLKEIYEIFVKETPVTMAALRAAMDEQDGEGIFFSAHNLKSAADRIGAYSCRNIAAELEQAAKHLDSGRIGTLAEALFKELEAVFIALEKNEN